MDEKNLRGMIERVKEGRLSRRGFIQRMAVLGLTAPMATQLLAFGGVAMAETPFTYKPTKAGAGGTLKLLWWEAPTLLNPHFATGTKDQDASRLFYEPLAAWDPEANLKLILAAEVPSVQNGGIAEDGTFVIWKLKKGVKWHDGQPFTADDVVFNWEYASNPQTAAVTAGSYNYIKVQKIDDYTVKVLFSRPTPFWADPFVAANGCLIPKHLFEPYIGAKSRQAPWNLKPVGTGPYKFKSFTPGDLVEGVINTDYHQPYRPYFAAVEMKGGGDATSAARAVMETAEYDYAWDLQVSWDLLKKIQAGGKGRLKFAAGTDIEHIQINFTDPNKVVDGQRSSIETKNPTLSDPVVRKALSLLVNRGAVEKYIYGETGWATSNFLNGPAQYVSKKTSWEFNIQKAVDLLEANGWKPGPDGIRQKDGKKLSWLYQTSINQPRQETQEIVKQACHKAGIDLQLKAILASVYFSSDVGNDDTYPKFYADLQMYTTNPTDPDPGFWMQQFLSTQVAQKSNKWQGRNITRWQNAEYDKIYAETTTELDPMKRAAMFIQLNDLVVDNVVVIPLIFRKTVGAAVNELQMELSGWDDDTWDLADWYKETKA
ncbi:MAG TPA: peptide ABC transporter substrate-binding protein [Acetobacteraceae bacterium]|jgi:peptide/nickel transport system substrate-binding protein|nr:peptide ABC transporter substrate-binding protein [Acetobacteraceae bacterium]